MNQDTAQSPQSSENKLTVKDLLFKKDPTIYNWANWRFWLAISVTVLVGLLMAMIINQGELFFIVLNIFMASAIVISSYYGARSIKKEHIQEADRRLRQYRLIIAPVIIIIAAFLLFLIFTDNRFISHYSAKYQPPYQNKIYPSPTPNLYPESTSSVVPANWKTYTTNDQLDIEDPILKQLPNFKRTVLTFKYPPSWKIVRNTNTKAVFTPNSNHTFLGLSLFLEKDSEQAGGGEAGPTGPFASIDMQFGIIPPGVKDFDAVYWGGGQVHQKEENTLINNIDVTQGYYSASERYPSETLFHISPNTQLYTRNSNLYENFNNPTLFDKKSIKEINQILSTFKFIQ